MKDALSGRPAIIGVRCAGLRPPGRLLAPGLSASRRERRYSYQRWWVWKRVPSFTAESPPTALLSSMQHTLQGRFRGLLLLQKPSPLPLRPAAPGFHKKSIPLHLQERLRLDSLPGLRPNSRFSNLQRTAASTALRSRPLPRINVSA